MNILDLLRRVRDILASDRASLFEAERDPRTGDVNDPEARRIIAEYDDLLGELGQAIQHVEAV